MTVHHHPQAGILNRPPDNALVAALELTATDPTAAAAAIDRLRAVVHAELRSDLAEEDPLTSKTEPPPETGELGFHDGFDRYHLTVTVGFAATAYDKLGTPPEQRPQDLIPIPWLQLGDGPDRTDNGDLLLQICSDSVYITEHVLRRVEHELAADLRVLWCVAGQQRHTSRSGRVNRDEGRALIGFLDGTANLDPQHNPDHAKLVFVDPAAVSTYPPQLPVVEPGQPNPYGGPQPPTFPTDLRRPPAQEPVWTTGGTYMVVRASLIDTTPWDATTLGDQEHIIGRWKYSGNALDQPDNDQIPIAAPNFAADPDGSITPLTAHIRKTNPRGPDDPDRRIFRRGYPLIAATIDGARRGLLFICFGRTITTQFEFITRAWTTNPNFPHPDAGIDALRRFEHVLAGGYYFVPPLQRANEPWSWIIPS
jgi:deferrochelatase/peroxidase EfeB